MVLPDLGGVSEDDAWFCNSFTNTMGGMRNGVIYLNPPALAHSPAYSHGAIVPPGARLIEIGGQNGVGPDGEIVAVGDVAAQTARALENIRTVLTDAGAGIDSILSLRISVVDGADLHAGFTAWGAFWRGQKHQPLITVARVASLVVPDALVEIEARAVVRNDGMTDASVKMWTDFVMNHPNGAVAGAAAAAAPGTGAWAFGTGVAMETELAELVVAGTKRATASSFHALLMVGEPVPKVGQFSIVLDGTGSPRCIIQTTNVKIAPLNSVSEAFAWREGEGDRSREYWLDVHRTFFRAEHAELDLPFSDDIPVVFEEFSVLWPLDVADQ